MGNRQTRLGSKKTRQGRWDIQTHSVLARTLYPQRLAIKQKRSTEDKENRLKRGATLFFIVK